VNLGFLSGTGIEGRGLALRFGSAGVPVVIGSRSEERARTAAASCNELLGTEAVSGCSNTEMLGRCPIVFLTVPFANGVDAVEACRPDLRPDHILVDVTVPMRFAGGRPEFVELEAGSSAEEIARHVPEGVAVVGAFKTIPAHVLAEVGTELRCDVFVCGDRESAREEVIRAVGAIPHLRALDAGPLVMARALERMTWLAVSLNRRYKRKGARFAVQGL
jgi:8-hydroxy-5-deazaflavin:NADPH oxidoreductase